MTGGRRRAVSNVERAGGSLDLGGSLDFGGPLDFGGSLDLGGPLDLGWPLDLGGGRISKIRDSLFGKSFQAVLTFEVGPWGELNLKREAN